MPKGPLVLIAAAFASLCQELATDARAADCVTTTPEIAQMEEAALRILAADASSVPLTVKVADDNRERAAGFQHICPAAVEHTVILFEFDKDTQSPFHMRNCHAPLDIAFMDADGVVVDTMRMEPYVDSVLFVRQPLYQSRAPFRYALETAAGRMEQLGIEVGTRLALP